MWGVLFAKEELVYRFVVGLAVWTATVCAAEPVRASQAAEPHLPCDRAAARRASLSLLRGFYTAPAEGESNHYFDLWGDGRLRRLVRAAGLGDTHTLFIDSHGRARFVQGRARYVCYPREDRWRGQGRPPEFTAEDFAAVLGRAAVRDVRNIVVGGCNAEGAFDPIEWRRLFPNATNIIHAPAGELGYEPMLVQILFVTSDQITPLYQTTTRGAMGKAAFDLSPRPQPGAVRLAPYVAELFERRGPHPYRIQPAGRELLAGPSRSR